MVISISDSPNVLVSAGFLAETLNLTERRINQLAERRVFKRNGRGQFNLRDCVHSYIDYVKVMRGAPDSEGSANPLDDKARLLKAQADIAEMEAEQGKASLVPRAPIEAGLATMALAIKDRLLTVPLAAAPEALDAGVNLGAKGVAEVYAKHISVALTDISTADVVARAVH